MKHHTKYKAIKEYIIKNNHFCYVHDDNLYAIEYPSLKNEPEIIEPGIRWFEIMNSGEVALLYDNKVVITDGREYPVSRGFKVSTLKGNITVFSPHCITFISKHKEITIMREVNGTITDGCISPKSGWLHYVMDGNFYATPYLSNHIKKATLPHKLYKLQHDVPLFDNGFVVDNAFIQVHRRPTYVTNYKHTIAFIDDALYYFKILKNRMGYSKITEGISGMYVCAKDEMLILHYDNGDIGGMLLDEFEDLNNNCNNLIPNNEMENVYNQQM